MLRPVRVPSRRGHRPRRDGSLRLRPLLTRGLRVEILSGGLLFPAQNAIFAVNGNTNRLFCLLSPVVFHKTIGLMKTLSSWLFFCGVALCAAACAKEEGLDHRSHRVASFVNTYCEVDRVVLRDPRYYGFHDDNRILYFYEFGREYRSAEIGGEGEEALRFRELAERKGDTGYDRWVEKIFLQSALADDLCAVHAVCPRAAWDEAHPAGSSLDDVVFLAFRTHAPYVRSGYSEGDGMVAPVVRKRLSELTPADLTLIAGADGAGGLYLFDGQYLEFERMPEQGEYAVEVTFVFASGRKCTADYCFRYGW